MRIALRGPTNGISIEIGPARPLPLDWDAWRDALIDGTRTSPIIEAYTIPEGWSMTMVETTAPDGIRVYAFYAVLDQAIPARAVGLAPAQAAAARELFRHAAPVWDDAIVALVDL